jgi:hypothetical protein
LTYWANECWVVFLPEGYDLVADYIYRCPCQEWNRRELQRRQMAEELLAQRIAQWQAENRATAQTERTEPPTNAQPDSQTADPGQLAARISVGSGSANASPSSSDEAPGPPCRLTV